MKKSRWAELSKQAAMVDAYQAIEDAKSLFDDGSAEYNGLWQIVDSLRSAEDIK